MKDLSLHILDIVQNSLTAGAGLIRIDVVEDISGNSFTVSISDNGCGMTAEQLEKVRDPYFTSRTTRKVGMGIPLFEQTARQAGGHLTIDSIVGEGTTIQVHMVFNHIDRPALGDIAGVISMLAGANPNTDFIYHHGRGDSAYSFDTMTIKEVLGDISLGELPVMRHMKQMIEEGLAELPKASDEKDNIY